MAECPPLSEVHPADTPPVCERKTLADFFGNQRVIDTLSYLIAKFERRKNEMAVGIFRTVWGKKLFYQGLRDINRVASSEMFDVDQWFRLMRNQAQSQGPEYVDADVLGADIKTDWASALLLIEQSIPGFLRLLTGVLKLEDQSHGNLATMIDYNKNGGDTLKSAWQAIDWHH
jgi:hypothetical protein